MWSALVDQEQSAGLPSSHAFGCVLHLFSRAAWALDQLAALCCHLSQMEAAEYGRSNVNSSCSMRELWSDPLHFIL